MRIVVLTATVLALTGAVRAEPAASVIQTAKKGVVTICAIGGLPRKPDSAPFYEEETPGSNVVGSGIVFSEDGLVLTAYHVIAGVEELSVVMWDLTEAPASVVAVDKWLDLAVVRVQKGALTPLAWRTGVEPEVGEDVFAIGTPGVFSIDPEPSVSRGIVSALHRSIDGTDFPEPPFLINLIETDAQVLPGQSGGALVDTQGRLLGMCVAIYRTADVMRSRAFALPADAWLRDGIGRLISEGAFPAGTLGIDVEPFTLESARKFGLPVRYGIGVAWPTFGGPAASAGIKRGDVITHVGGEPVKQVWEFRRIEMRLTPGSTVKINATRRGAAEPLEFDVIVGSYLPGDLPVREEFHWRGMTIVNIDDRLRKEYNLPVRNGVVVVEIERNGKAHRAGVRRGEAILEINNTRVDSLVAFKDAVEGISEFNVVRVRTTEGIGHIQGEKPRE